MKRYTIKNLPTPTMSNPEDLRLIMSTERFKFIWCAFKNNVLYSSNWITRGVLILVLIGIIWNIVRCNPAYLLLVSIALLLLFLRVAVAVNQMYSVLRKGNCFPVLTKEGPQQIMDNGGRYIRIETARWQDVESINFYRNLLVIEMKDESDSGFFFMWTDNMEKAKATALSMWSLAMDTDKERNSSLELYSETEVNELSAFIEQNFGAYDFVLHEIASPDIHVDIAIIPPVEGRNYYTLCTMGVGAHRMNMPDEARLNYQIAERAELLIYLPADWKMDEESFKNEYNYWPIRLLKDFARMPIGTDSWMTWGHTMADETNEPYADDTPYSAAVLLSPQPIIDDNVSCPLSTGKSVDFYQVFPITSDELEYKINYYDDEDEIDEENNATYAMLKHMGDDYECWMDYVLSRFDYRNKK